MKAEERRNNILEALREADEPVSASVLAARFHVSRQIVVGDIALLRAGGAEISATPRGYVLSWQRESAFQRRIACMHGADLTEKELNICVDNGCQVLDVIVEHPLYGQLTGGLRISSRYDVQQFMKKSREEGARALSELTNGVHLHTLRCPRQEAYDRVIAELKKEGILFR